MKDLRFKLDTFQLVEGCSATVLLSCSGLNRAAAVVDILPNREGWRDFLTAFLIDPTTLPGYGLLKYSRVGEVYRVSFPVDSHACAVVCKQSRVLGLKRLWSRFRPSRERRNFERGFALLRSGIGTAVPLAVIERHTPKREAWLITEFLADVIDLDQVAGRFLSAVHSARRQMVKNALIGEIAQILLRFRGAGWTHRDFKASNLLVGSWNSATNLPQIFIVDMDGVRGRKPLDHWQPIVRLVASLRPHRTLTRADLARLVREYLAQTGEPANGWKSCFRRIDRSSARYLRASLGRKTGKLDAYGGE